VHVVAEVRSDHNSRQHERTEITLGTWQIALTRAISKHLKTKAPMPANTEGTHENKRQLRSANSVQFPKVPLKITVALPKQIAKDSPI
jgi:hypothetical protein